MVIQTGKRLYRLDKGLIPGKWFYWQGSGFTGGNGIELGPELPWRRPEHDKTNIAFNMAYQK